jgi:serine/threonine-protein kinase
VSVDPALLAGRYRVIRRLGRGGSGTVYLARDERLGREVAVKRLHADSPDDVARRFEREARLGASLNHPNVVAVFDIETDDEGVLIVQEYVEGTTLAQALRERPLDPERAVAIVEGIAAALDHAHRHGIVHRDVKPANVLLRPDGTVKLADLGIATAVESAPLTRTGTVLGTPAYMAPEQFEGGGATRASDVYALASVAFEALAGRRAHTGATPLEVARRIVTEPAPDVREAWPEATDELAHALARGMARETAERPPSAGALADELRRAFGAAAASAAPPAPPFRDAAGPGAPAPPPPIDRDATEQGTPAPGPEREATQRGTPPPAPSRGAPPPPSDGAPRPARRSRRTALLGTLALLAFAGAGGAVLAARDAGEGEPARTRAAPRQAERPVPDTQAAESKAAPDPAPDEGPAPEAAVRAFYERSAADDFEAAWALAGPGFREQLGGFESFRGTLDSLEGIEFTRLETVEQNDDRATVAVATRATHPDRTDVCSGTVALSRPSEEWLIDRANVGCGRG